MIALLLSGIPVTVAAISSEADASGSEPSVQTTGGIDQIYSKDGLTYSYRSLTTSDIASLKEAMGVRQDGVDYNVMIDGHGTGLAPPSESEWASISQNTYLVEDVTSGIPAAPASLDLSASSYFPAVGNQGGQGSCAAWAVTYYAYGYMEALDQGWSSAKSGVTSQLLSPAFTYNRMNDYDHGTSLSGNAQIIINWGVPTLSTMPYDDSDYLSWGSDTAMREASLHRGASSMLVSSPTIDAIKAVLQAGKPVTFAIDGYQYSTCFSDNSGQKIISASEYNGAASLNHAQTIVGWDDSVNDDGEYGAFKVVNSWGTSFGNSGYYWMTYDAIFEVWEKQKPFYLEDIADYVPEIGATLHFGTLPGRDMKIVISLVNDLSGTTLATRTLSYRQTFSYGAMPNIPAYIYYDISEFADLYSTENCRFVVTFSGDTSVGTVTSFKVEWYEGGYVPGQATHVSAQSANLPALVTSQVSLVFNKYALIGDEEALDTPYAISGTSSTRWVPVMHKSKNGGDAMQSGDIADGKSSDMTATITGPVTIAFWWMISADTSDTLTYYLDASSKGSISGSTSWTQVSLDIPSGTHTVRWVYLKSAGTSALDDCAYVDYVASPGSGGDVTAPVTTATLSGTIGTNSWYQTNVGIGLSATDDSSGVAFTKYRIDSGVWTTYPAPFTVTGDGTHTVEYYSVDATGNTETTKSVTFKKDATVPVTGSSVSGTTVTLSASDATSGISSTKYRIDSGTWQTYSAAFNAGSTGSHTVEFYSIDLAGNSEGVRSIQVGSADTTAPTTSITLTGTLGNNGWYRSAVTVSLSASDNGGSGVQSTFYRWKGTSTWTTYTVPFSVSTSGIRTLEYYSVDLSGNNESIKSTTFKIDLKKPATSHSVNDDMVSLAALDEDSGIASIQYRVDGGSWTTYSATFSVGSVWDEHQIDVQATDLAGNMEDLSSFEVGTNDDVSPVTSITVQGTAGDNGWFVSSVTVSLTSSDAISGVDQIIYSLDGASWTEYAAPFAISEEGIHVLEYRAVDIAGNVELIKSIDINVDRTVPTTTADHVNDMVILSPIDAISGVAFTYYRFDGGLEALYAGPIVIVDPRVEHTISYRSEDNAGNAEPAGSLTIPADNTREYSAPSEPQNIQAVAGCDTITVSWSAPSSDGNVTLLGYKLYRGVGEGPATFLMFLTATTYSDTDIAPGMTYNYFVRANNSIGDSAPSSEVQVSYVLSPSMVPNLTAEVLGGHVLLAWTAPEDGGSAITGYLLTRMSGGESDVIGVDGPVLQYEDENIEAGTTYAYQVRAVNMIGEGPDSAEVSVHVPYQMAAPNDLVAIISGQNVSLSWTAPSGSAPDGYQVSRSDDGSMFTSLATVTSTSYLDQAVEYDVNYAYQVCAVYGGEPGPSATVDVLMVSPLAPPTSILSLTVSVEDGSIALSWSVNEAVGGYHLYRSTFADMSNEVLLVTTIGTSYVDVSVAPGIVYYYQVSCYNADGEGPRSLPVEASLPVEEDIPAPMGLTVQVTDGTVNISWDPVDADDVVGYRLYRSVDGGPLVLLTSSVGTSFEDENVDIGHEYRYWVCAYAADWEGLRSGPVLATLSAPPVTVPKTVMMEMTEAGTHLSWQAAEGDVIGYNVYRGNDPGNMVLVASLPASMTEFLDGDGDEGQYYSISAIYATGEGERSSPIMAVGNAAESDQNIVASMLLQPWFIIMMVLIALALLGTGLYVRRRH